MLARAPDVPAPATASCDAVAGGMTGDSELDPVGTRCVPKCVPDASSGRGAGTTRSAVAREIAAAANDAAGPKLVASCSARTMHLLESAPVVDGFDEEDDADAD